MEEKITINQPVDKMAYKKLKALAAMQDKKIQDVVNEAIIFYVEKKGK